MRMAPALPVRETAFMPRKEQSVWLSAGGLQVSVPLLPWDSGKSETRAQHNYLVRHLQLVVSEPVIQNIGTLWPPASHSFRSRHYCTGCTGDPWPARQGEWSSPALALISL